MSAARHEKGGNPAMEIWHGVGGFVFNSSSSSSSFYEVALLAGKLLRTTGKGGPLNEE